MANLRKVFLNISEIASFIGKNPYDCVSPFNRLWKKCDSEEYNKALMEINGQLEEKEQDLVNLELKKKELQNDLDNKKITKRQYTSKVKEIFKTEENTKIDIKEISRKIETVKLTKTEQVEKILGKNALDVINDINSTTESKREATLNAIESLKLSDEDKTKLIKTTENVINTTHGTIKENSAIDQFEKKFKVKLDTSQEYHKRQIGTIKNTNYSWFIGGKVDGLYISKEKSYVVEVKNRTKGFFSSLREYEKCQIQLYMWILDLDEAKLVEKYKEKIRITAIFRDQEFIDDILEYLEIFINNFEHKFLNSYRAKIDFLNKSDDHKKAYLNKLYLSEITILSNTKLENKIIKKESEEDCLLDDLD